MDSSDFEPQIKEQMRSVVRTIYEFFLNRLEQGRLLETVIAQRSQVIDVAANIQVVLNVPALRSILEGFGINPELISAFVNVDQINSYFDLLERVARAQALVVFIKNLYIPLIGIIVALIIGIVFAARKAGLIALVLGSSFVTYGILQLLSLLALGTYRRLAIGQLDLSPAVNASVNRFIGDIANILLIFSAVLLAGGLALIVTSFFLKPRKSTA